MRHGGSHIMNTMKVSIRRGFVARIVVITLLAMVLTFGMSDAVSAESIFVLSHHNARLLEAWNINPGGTFAYQGTYGLQYTAAPAGVAVHIPTETLFISNEGRGMEVVDSVDFDSLGRIAIAQIAGLAVDDSNGILYAMRRGSNELLAYDFDRPDPASPEDPESWTATLRAGFP